MDIRRWLDETVLPQQPPSPHDQRSECSPLRVERLGRLLKKKHKRKQSTSDSSLLDNPQQRRSSVVPEQGNTFKEDAYQSSRASHPTSRSGGSVSSEPYKRKPRRKTRPERYEPVPKGAKERGTHTRRHKNGESRKARRISKPSKSDKPGNGIVQSFQAKNVPRDRLTLKPREKLGLFSKGRVSSPVKGRGLPDLVFSEMKFLQKNKDQPEPDLQLGSPRKKRKQDQAHAEHEEISAYFTSVRPTLAEQVLNIQAKDVSRQRLRGDSRPQRQPSPAVDNAIPTVEPASNPVSLAIGRTRSSHEDGSYISWSESIVAPDIPPAQLHSTTKRDSGQRDSMLCRVATDNSRDGESLHLQPAHPTVSRHLMDDGEGQFQLSSLPPTTERQSRSHSLPQHTSSPHRTNPVDRVALRRNLETVASLSSLPQIAPTRSEHRPREVRADLSHVPLNSKVKDSALEIQPLGPSGHVGDNPDLETEHHVQEEADQPASSSSLGQILQCCNSAFHQMKKVQTRQPRVRATSSEIQPQPNVRFNSTLHPTIQKIPTVRFSGIEDVCRPGTSRANRSNIYEQQEKRQYEVSSTICPPINDLGARCTAQNKYFEADEFDYSQHDLAEEVESEDYGLGPLICNKSAAEPSGDVFVEAIQSRNKVTGKPGFWRPHKLY